MNSGKSIGIIGLGNMGMAIAAGLRDQNLKGFDIRTDSCQRAEKAGIEIAKDNSDLVQRTNIIILAVKPQEIEGVLKEIKNALTEKKLLISIAAGVSTGFIERFAGKIRVIRVMPNIAILAGEGACAVCRGRYATESDQEVAAGIFRRMGRVYKIAERYIDAVTAISGSGPAYFFEFIELLTKAGKKLGLSPSISKDLVFQTAKGAVKMLESTKKEPAELRDMVTSRKGTTIKALEVFRRHHLERIVFNAVSAARKRAGQLSR